MKSITSLFLFLAILIGASAANPDHRLITRIESKVTIHLKSYYLTHQLGTFQVLVDITETHVVEDEPGRFVTTGRATISFFGNSQQNYGTNFTVTTEIDDANVVRVTNTQSQRASN